MEEKKEPKRKKRVYTERRKILFSDYFFFGRNPERQKGRLVFRFSFSNIYLTLVDLRDKVVICKTSGCCEGLKGSKRKKRTPQAVEALVKEILPILRLYNITLVDLVLRVPRSFFVYTLVRDLTYFGIKVIKFTRRRKIAFNGVKGRKSR